MKTKLTQKNAFLLKMLNIFCSIAILLLAANYSFGQAPDISYPSPQSYSTGIAISPLTPSNTGGAVSPTTIDVLASGLNSPIGVALDAPGNVYFADNVSNVVKKIPVGGGAPVVIGTGFNSPVGIASDAAGNVYVCDQLNNAVKEIPAAGGAILSLGSGFMYPNAVALDNAGNIYVADQSGLKEMPPGGGTPVSIITLQPGNFIFAVSVDAAGNIFYAGGSLNQLKEKLATGGPDIVIASEPVNNIINGISLDVAGNVYYSDSKNSYITKVTLGTGQKAKIGSGFTAPQALALDAAGKIYVSDGGANTISRITVGGYFINPALPPGLNLNANTGVISGTPTLASPAANYTVTALNNGGSGSAVINLTVVATAKPVISYGGPNVYRQNNHITPLIPANSGGDVSPVKPAILLSNLNWPIGVTVDASGNVYYVENRLNQVKMIPATGGSPVVFGTGLNDALGITIDGSGNVFVGDQGSGSIKKIPAGGGIAVTFATGNFSYPAIAADNAGNVYTVTTDNKIIKFSPSGIPVTVAASGVFNNSEGLALDHAGNIYTTQINQGTIIEVRASDHHIVNLASVGTTIIGAAADISGNVFFIELTNHNVSMYVAATGKIITIGKGLSEAHSLAVDVSGNVYVTDLRNQLLVKYSSSGYFADEALPAGMVIDKTTGVITGTPTVSSPATTYNVTAINSGGSSSASFSLKVLANSSLSNLVPSVSNLGPPFKPETLDYNMTVASSVSSITFTPTTADTLATVTVNGLAVASGTASAAIPLTTGDNAVHVVVTATDGSKSTYSVLVTRVPSGNYYLATLLTSNGILSPTFTHLTNNYTTQVGAYVASMTVTPTVVDSTATITVNGTPLASGATSAAIPLIVGTNPINIAVTAQNGTVNTYTINVTRVPSTNAYLMRILLNHGYDVPLFSHLIFNYATPVPNAVSAIKVTPVGAVSSSIITVNGAVVVSGTASGDIPLAVGVNNISILVTAQDGVTQNTYTVTVTREPPSLNTVYQPVGVATTNGLNQLNEDGLLVHSGLSPNGDGINDFLLIDGIANYPENKLQIMTRNGQLIFEAKNYDNSTKVFDGHSNKTGQLQLPGTYFYSLDYVVNGVVKHKTGFVVLKN